MLLSINENGILKEILNTLNKLTIKDYQNEVEIKIVNFLIEPLKENFEGDDGQYIKIFKEIFYSNFEFNPLLIKSIFKNWEKNNNYLNSLLRIIKESKKDKYLPESVLRTLINNPIDEKSIEIMENWDHTNIPNDIGKKLVNILVQRVQTRNISNLQLLNSQRKEIEQDLKLLILVDETFIDNDVKDQFFSTLKNFINRIFQNSNDQEQLIKIGVCFWFEIAWFADNYKEYVDEMLRELYLKYIATNELIIKKFKDKIIYVERILSLNETKKAIFKNSEMQRIFYKNLDEKYFSNFSILFTYPIETNHIDIFSEVAKEKSVKVDFKVLYEFITKNIVRELIEYKIDVSVKLKYVEDKFGLRKFKEIFINEKNGIIDFVKSNPEIGVDFLFMIKPIFNYSDFYRYFLYSLFSYLNTQLDSAVSIDNFYKITGLIESTKDLRKVSLLYDIITKCLERNQDIRENYIGILILEKINEYLNDKQKSKITELIKNNDNKDKWDINYLEILKKLGLTI
ncbi:hypothetical protein ACX8XN_03525 [Calditrichota bacterium GD2]